MLHFEVDRVGGNIGKIQPYMFEPDPSFEEEEDVGFGRARIRMVIYFSLYNFSNATVEPYKLMFC